MENGSKKRVRTNLKAKNSSATKSSISTDETLEINTDSQSVKVENDFVKAAEKPKVTGKKEIKAAFKKHKQAVRKQKIDASKKKKSEKSSISSAKKEENVKKVVNKPEVSKLPVQNKKTNLPKKKVVSKKTKIKPVNIQKNKKIAIKPIFKIKPKSQSKTKTKSKKNPGNVVIISLLSLGIISVYTCLFLLYGPWNGFRDWFITTAMSTMNHQYLASWFYSDATIADCLNRNRVIEVDGISDKNLINIADYGNFEEIAYANEYERQILERDPNNNDYKIIKLEGENYEGYMAVIYDPSRVEVATSIHIGSYGEYLTDMSKRTNALVAINAGGFQDMNGQGTGSSPLGITISKGQTISTSASPYGTVGFTNEDKLLLGRFSYQEVMDNNFRDSVSFGPYLILNGESSRVLGNGGWGNAPRTAIGQRADGIVLFVVFDGNRVVGRGATINDMIDVFERYGAINATNLDGGTSTSMTVKGKTVNNPSNLSGSNVTRPIPTAFILTADDSDDGDYSAVKDKVDN